MVQGKHIAKEHDGEKLEYNWTWNTCAVVYICSHCATMKKILSNDIYGCRASKTIWILCKYSLSLSLSHSLCVFLISNEIPFENWICMQMTDSFFFADVLHCIGKCLHWWFTMVNSTLVWFLDIHVSCSIRRSEYTTAAVTIAVADSFCHFDYYSII